MTWKIRLYMIRRPMCWRRVIFLHLRLPETIFLPRQGYDLEGCFFMKNPCPGMAAWHVLTATGKPTDFLIHAC